MQFREHRLDNGLDIIAECNPGAHSLALGFFVNTGARDETDDVAGVSHFLEHMAFKGTPQRTAEDVNREFDEIGSHANAFTSEEHTVYYASVLPEWQDRALEILSDILRPALRDEDAEVERKVILEEIAKYEDQPPFGAAEKCMAAHFPNHPLGRNVLGTAASVSRLSPAAMRRYFEQRYSPNNITLVAAGNLDFERLVSEAESRCGGWKPQPVLRERPAPGSRGGFHVYPKASALQQYVVQIADGPSAEDQDRYAAHLLAAVLGDDSGSRMFWDLVDTGQAECASMAAYEFEQAGILMTFLCSAPEQAQKNLARVRCILQDAEHHGVGEAELARAKSKICSQVVLQSERPSNRLFAVGGNWLQRREYRTVRETVDAYQAVTCDQVAGLLRRYPLTANTTVAVGPLTRLSPP